VIDDLEILVLLERVEREPQAEALGERDLLLDRLAVVDLAVDVVRFEILAHVLWQQVAAVGRSVDQHVLRRCVHGAVEYRLERFEARIIGLEGQIVAEEKEAFGPVVNPVDDVRQVDELGLVDLDDPQPFARVLIDERFDERRLAGTARAPQQRVVRGQTPDELTRVANELLLLTLDSLQVVEANAVGMVHGLHVAAAAMSAPSEGYRPRPLRVGGVSGH